MVAKYLCSLGQWGLVDFKNCPRAVNKARRMTYFKVAMIRRSGIGWQRQKSPGTTRIRRSVIGWQRQKPQDH